MYGYEGGLGHTYGYVQVLQAGEGRDKRRLVKLLLWRRV